MADRKTPDEIKEYIFDDLLEFLEETGESNAITAGEIADLIGDSAGRVQAVILEMVEEGLLKPVRVDGVLHFRFSEDKLEELLDEMEAEGWSPPGDSEDEDED